MSRTARDVMRTEVRTVGPQMTLPDLERAFLEAQVSGFPVVEEGRLLGIVARSDVLRQLSVEQSVAEVISDYYRDFGGRPVAEEESFEALASHVGRRMETLRVADVMNPSVLTVSPDEPLAEVARRLLEEHIHRVPVVEGEQLLGIISTLDFVRLYAEKTRPGC